MSTLIPQAAAARRSAFAQRSRVKASEFSDPANKAARAGAVKAAFAATAGQLLGEVGPRDVSVRDVARRAGVNHGQIHHDFGAKRGLLEAALCELAGGHYADFLELFGGEAIPAPLSLGEPLSGSGGAVDGKRD